MTTSSDDRFAIENFEWLDRFIPNRWWRGGWLQTLSIKAIRANLSVEKHEGSVAFDVPGDQTPPDMLSGYYLPAASEARCPTVVLFHGMGGHAKSGYMLSMASQLLGAEYNVILWNNRGAGDSSKNCSRFHHPGYTDDINLLLNYLHRERPDWCRGGLAAIAFSLGANLLLKYLAEAGEESAFAAAMSVSAPLDMHATSQNLRCGTNRLFDRYLLYRQQQELLRESGDLMAKERSVIQAAGSVWELDDKFTGPHLGYDNAVDFYRDNSAIHVLDHIRTPTLLFHAADDPVVDAAVFTDREWAPSGPLFPALADSGGHTGFLDRDGLRWHERASTRFLDAVLDHEIDIDNTQP